MKYKIYEYQDKYYIRKGECNQCGECCLGWKNPCPMLEIIDSNKTKCKIHSELNKENNQEVFNNTGGVMTKACDEFPTIGDFNSLNIRNKCGYYFIEVPKVLVACPTYDGKEYSMQRWIDMATNLTYPNYEIFVVDNSDNLNFYNKWKDKIPLVHLDVNDGGNLNKITKSMEVIRQKFLNGDYERWMNIEIDVIPPLDIIEKLLELGKNSDWISHCYPVRGAENTITNMIQGIGCSMLTKHLVKDFNYNEAGDDSPDAWLWNNVRNRKDFTTMELWNYCEVKHLAD